MGSNSGLTDQNNTSIALCFNAGSNSQGTGIVAICNSSGNYDARPYSISIGYEAGSNQLGNFYSNNIVLNASNATLDAEASGGGPILIQLGIMKIHFTQPMFYLCFITYQPKRFSVSINQIGYLKILNSQLEQFLHIIVWME